MNHKSKIAHLIGIIILSAVSSVDAIAQSGIIDNPILFVYKLHGQTRKYQYEFIPSEGKLTLKWGIERNTKWQSGTFTISEHALKNADTMSFLQPIDGENVILPDNTTYLMISQEAYDHLKKHGNFTYNNTEYQSSGINEIRAGFPLIPVSDTTEGGRMWILDRQDFPIIWEMADNPLEINWKVDSASVAH